MSELVYLGLGSNISDRETNIFTAIAALDVRDEITVKRTASIYETDPLYETDQPSFLNTVVEIQTELEPESMLQVCQGIELMLGRPRDHDKNEPRVIDLDILAYKTKSVDLGYLKNNSRFLSISSHGKKNLIGKFLSAYEMEIIAKKITYALHMWKRKNYKTS